MSQNIPFHLLCDDLLLLIGTNTLPNWVAAQLLIKPGGTAHLGYTRGVRKHAERLKAVLEEEQRPKPEAERIKVEWFETNEADERKIFDDVRGRAASLKHGGGRVIGLNYTGGTKMMSVHAHRAMRDLNLIASLSYLDARSLQMKFDYPNGGEFDISLDSCIRIGIEKLIRLHDKYSDPQKNIQYQQKAKAPDAAAGLIEVYSKYSGQHVWGDWCRTNLKVGNLNAGWLKKNKPVEYQRHVHRFNGARLLNESEFSQRVKNHLNEPEQRINPPDVPRFLQKIVGGYGKMLKDLKANGGDSLQAVVQNSREFDDSFDLAKWLDGMWLEHYAFDQLQSVAGDCDINQNGLAINLETVNYQGRRFEADVVALRGYQLFYLTCYTGSENDRSKQKLFEALERAGQLGGDESKIGLVCNSDSPAKLRQECEADWERLVCNQIEVFGREDLPVLSGELTKWFNGQRRSGR
jgi:hypothetical protein